MIKRNLVPLSVSENFIIKRSYATIFSWEILMNKKDDIYEKSRNRRAAYA